MIQDFNWNLSGLNKREFTAYANLLALRNDGQVEPVSLGTELSDKNESTTNSDAISIDTSYYDQISDSGYHQLRTKFLDCLAELTANRKGGKYVACSNLPNRIVEEVLWNEMLAYYEDRLEDTYIPNLRLSLKNCNTVFNDDNNDKFARARNELSVLQNQTFATLEAGQRLIDRHGTLVTKAYELRKSKVVEEFLQTSPKSTKQTRKLWIDMFFSGGFESYLRNSKRIPQKALKGALKLREALNLLGLPTDTLTVATVIRPSWTVAKAEREYGKLQNQALNIHAEIKWFCF
ncbi:uncharacterized protein EAF01_001240 [Botrytis porri]|uniref:uncharacterized protein n=1 Tax=Botrytis porri TaxID=87229 RepID=UPI0018FF14FA|nr:uncharacterized protein EAF01_001240 [Botrytis porri]KAF7912219.1 hypothetical protein EAF01_001240 [Botrytis porri]